jgi:heat shock protein HslJ
MPALSTLLALLMTMGLPACSNAPSELMEIRLEEFSRGIRRSILVTPDRTSVQVNDEEKSHPTPASTWEELRAQVQKLSLDSLHETPVISKKHQFDGALHTTLTITTADTTYSSPTFDHDVPPAVLKPLVDRLRGQIPASLKDRF